MPGKQGRGAILDYDDECVKQTNSESLNSKLSLTKQGYRHDPFLAVFRGDAAKCSGQRSAGVNRGYLARVVALENTFEKLCLMYSHILKAPHNVLSLGAGYDTMYFRLRNQGVIDPSLCRYFEVDFPIVAHTKSHFIWKSPEFNRFFDRVRQSEDLFVYQSHSSDNQTAFALVGVDMVKVGELQGMLKAADIDLKLPTIVLTECSLTYVEVEEADRLTRWLAKTFPQLLLVDYEQINPGDTFGRIMTNHFASRNSPLRCIQTYPTIDHHTRRFRDIGMTHVEVRTLSEIMSRFGDHQGNDATHADQVGTGISGDQFDEFEEVQLKCSHYIILLATNSDEINQNILPLVKSLRGVVKKKRYFEKKRRLPCHKALVESPFMSRYGHVGLRLLDGQVLVFGGSTESGRSYTFVKWDDKNPGSTPIEAIAIKRDSSTNEAHPVPPMLSAGSASSRENVFWIFGGRSSPEKSSNELFKVSGHDLSFLEHQQMSSIPPRWRHTLTATENDCLVVVGGRGGLATVQRDIWLIETQNSNRATCIATLPFGIHSHSACQIGENRILITGGITCVGEVNQQLFIVDVKSRTLRTVTPCPDLNERLIPRFSHTLHRLDSKDPNNINIVLLGGVSSAVTQPDICLVTIDILKEVVLSVKEVELECQENASTTPPLIYCHGSVVADGGESIKIIGGGGNCFSFGMNVNKAVFSVQIKDLEKL